MKAWSAALGAEVGGWPKVSARIFFGFTAIYRKDTMFAVLPRTRGMDTPNALAFRIDAPSGRIRTLLEKDARVGAAEIKKARWFSFELSSDADLHDALDWLAMAYEAAGKN
ncbi:MAG: hypothetical protein ABSG72_14125 [Candidatus Sulfotelmatobacter sp.]|jgi:hypothetical protein